MSELFNDAIRFATEAHAGQMRKMRRIPYIVHPMEVASVAAGMTDDENVLAAALLHDTVEDCGVDPQAIRERFGARVAALVLSETEDRFSTRPAEETWTERKADSLLMLEHTTDRGVQILWLSDKLANIRSIYREYCVRGYGVFESFHQKDPKMQAWYYRSVAKHLSTLSDTCAYEEYITLVEKIFGKI